MIKSIPMGSKYKYTFVQVAKRGMQEPEVYETSDIESEHETPQVQQSNPDIVEEEIEVGQSLIRFNNEFVNGRVNFDYVSDRPLNATGFKTYTGESLEQKLSRISKELAELDVNEKSAECDRLITLAEDLKSKRKNDVNGYKERIEKLFQNIESEVEESTDIKPQGKRRSNDSFSEEIIALDKKISQLESKIGNLNSKSLEHILNDMSRKVQIINNPEYKIKEVDEGIKQLLAQSETLKHLQDVNNMSSMGKYKSDKINEILSFLPYLNKYDYESELIIQRLKTLNQVHLDIGSSVNFVNNLDQQFDSLSEEIQSWRDSLKNVNDTLNTNIDNFETWKTHINDTLDQLTRKVQNNT